MKIFLLFLVSLSLYGVDTKFEAGKLIYQTTCISCHGENGKTNPEIKLIVKPRKLQETILTQEQSFKIIKHGANYWGAHADIMPAFKYVYNDDEIRNVAYYIAKAFNTNHTKKVKKLLKDSTYDNKIGVSLQVGKKIWTKKCAKCHAIKGDGKSEYVEKSKKEDEFIYPYNLRRTLLSEKQIFLYAKYGGNYWGAYKSDMPAWGRKYNDIELKSVAHYIKTKIIKIKK